jgi:D-alanyl-D-alanine carboxypeptidase/poly-gamma-glutamate capsule biosynthesis protein CapA/YwtB (metallophosphatase superfamily)
MMRGMSYKRKIFWGIFTIAVLFTSGFFLKDKIYQRVFSFDDIKADLGATPLSQVEEQKYFYFNKDPISLKKNLKVSSASYLVGDLDTGEIILKKNEGELLPIASVSKLMTALVSGELVKEDDVANVSKSAVATYGGNGNLYAGEKIKTRDLLYPLLLESSNDAAEVLAENFERETFIRKMNQQAEKLNMEQTSYEDPSGLSPNNQSTASDLFKLAGFLNKERKNLLEITTLRNFSNKRHNWSSNNQFLREEGYLGGKSGYTDPAKQTVISMFSVPLSESGNRNVAIVLLGSNDRFKDVKNILQYLKKNIYYGGESDANTAWVKQKEGIPEIKDPDYVTLAFAGDIMLDRGVRNSVLKNFGGNYSALFENLEILKKSDIVFGNLEGTASDRGRDGGSLYSFQMDPSVVPALKGAGFSVLSMANNHVGDYGLASYIDTLARLKENEILYAGGGNTSAEAEQPAIIEKYGIKIGFIAFSDVGPDWMRVKENQAGLLLASNPRFDEIVANAASQVDHLVVSFHFGEEYKTIHNARQEFLAHKAIDAGAKIVIGHHPHVMQDTESYKDGFIAYSLGNFIFDQSFSENTMQGMLLELKLGRDGNIATTKNIVKLNSVFQPETIIKSKEEKVETQ